MAIHHAYTALEAIFERAARALEGEIPSWGDWHHALLQRMALNVDGVLPALLSRETVDSLRGILGFRHFVRHGYRMKLKTRRLADLREELQRVTPLVHAELGRFTTYLRDSIAAEESRS